jgi:HD-GYP domain-containing protein (c-di-GMP phosphodiesterase class II)
MTTLSSNIAVSSPALETLTAIVNTLADIGADRDDETPGHLSRISAYSRFIAEGLPGNEKPSREKTDLLSLFASVHDIGKIKIPDSILFKPGKLTQDETEVMRKHVIFGSYIIDSVSQNFSFGSEPAIDILRNIVLYHHESMDGTGYPARLNGPRIPIESRIVSVADIFDALTSNRPYRDAWSIKDALRFLQEHSDIKVDKQCVLSISRSVPELENIRRMFPS